MDASISDILAAVTHSHNATNGLDDNSQAQLDLQSLTRSWVSERVAPELLPYPTELMERTSRRISAQVCGLKISQFETSNILTRALRDRKIETIEDSITRMDAGTNFPLVVIQTDLERFKFLVRSYLRARIGKIDAHPLHILALHNGENTTQSQSQIVHRLNASSPLLSPSEVNYAQTHSALLERHYNSSFLASFPAKLQRLDDRAGAGNVGMIEGPDLDKAVFVRCLGPRQSNDAMTNHSEQSVVEVSCGYTQLSAGNQDDDSSDSQRQGQRNGAERIVRMRRGDIWVVKWREVRDVVARGECELI